MKRTQPVVPVTPTRTQIVVDIGGVHRGGEEALATIAGWNASSPDVELSIRGIDQNPNRLREATAVAARLGLPFTAHRGRVQDVIAADGVALTERLLIMATDDARADAETCVVAAETPRPFLLYLIIRLPNKDLLGLSAVLPKAATDLKLALSVFLFALADCTVQRGFSAVLGAEGLPEHVFRGPHYRSLFRAHLADNIPRLLWELEPEAAPIEVTFDGEARLPFLIEDSRAGWRDAASLAREVLARPSVVIAPGKDLCIGEVGPDGIRLHIARYRAVDRALSLNETPVIDEAAMEEALRRGKRQTISRSYPVYTTD
jgi:hypothetical protein